METVIVIAAALIAIVLLEAGYRIALCLVCWAPSLAVGLFACWFAHRHGVGALAALGLGVVSTLVCRRRLASF